LKTLKPTLQVNIQDAKTHLSRDLPQVAAGEAVVIARAGKPIAKLGPIDPLPIKRKSILGALRHLGPIDDDAFRAMDKEIEDMFMEAADEP
jgi:antitoxin (DNA-binding transcriptional repressor) of toxin-antitoxin stability system